MLVHLHPSLENLITLRYKYYKIPAIPVNLYLKLRCFHQKKFPQANGHFRNLGLSKMRGEKSRRSQKRTTLRVTQLFQTKNMQKFLQNFFRKKIQTMDLVFGRALEIHRKIATLSKRLFFEQIWPKQKFVTHLHNFQPPFDTF